MAAKPKSIKTDPRAARIFEEGTAINIAAINEKRALAKINVSFFTIFTILLDSKRPSMIAAQNPAKTNEAIIKEKFKSSLR